MIKFHLLDGGVITLSAYDIIAYRLLDKGSELTFKIEDDNPMTLNIYEDCVHITTELKAFEDLEIHETIDGQETKYLVQKRGAKNE